MRWPACRSARYIVRRWDGPGSAPASACAGRLGRTRACQLVLPCRACHNLFHRRASHAAYPSDSSALWSRVRDSPACARAARADRGSSVAVLMSKRGCDGGSDGGSVGTRCERSRTGSAAEDRRGAAAIRRGQRGAVAVVGKMAAATEVTRSVQVVTLGVTPAPMQLNRGTAQSTRRAVCDSSPPGAPTGTPQCAASSSLARP